MVCRRLEMFPVECVARGYLTGSGLAEYEVSGSVTGIDLPPGLVDGSRLPEPIFTPATKAELGEHDENVPFETVVDTVGRRRRRVAARPHPRGLRRAEEIARRTGRDPGRHQARVRDGPATGAITLGDEVLTPDSSRFWPADLWQPGHAQASFDKQFVRDWLTSPASGWDRASDAPPPSLPADVVERTRARYLDAFERLTGAARGVTSRPPGRARAARPLELDLLHGAQREPALAVRQGADGGEHVGVDQRAEVHPGERLDVDDRHLERAERAERWNLVRGGRQAA